MLLALHHPNFTLPGGPEALAPTLAKTAQAADAAGWSTMTLMDHYFQMESLSRAEDPMLEGYSSLGFLAGKTENIQLGLLVTGVTYRHPGLLAKIVATLDVLSGGRAMLGIGIAWYEREHIGLGVPFPPIAERYERLEESIAICRQMWSEDDGSFDGQHYALAETICEPKPLRAGGPPVVIGGSGEKKTLRMVARHADACNLFAVGPDVVAHKLDVLRGHCETEGTDYDAIEKTILVNSDPLADVDEFLTSMEQYSALGVTKAWVYCRGDDPPAWVERMSEAALPRLTEI